MHCAACSSRIERVVGRMEGVERISVNLAAASAEVWPEQGVDAQLQQRIMDKVSTLGFSAAPTANDDVARQFEEGKTRAAADIQARLRRLLPMAAFAVPLLVISMGHMLGLPLPMALDPHHSPRAFMLAQLALTLPVVWLGRHFYLDGIAALLRKAPAMDSLVAVGTGAAFLFSLGNTLLGLAGVDPIGRAMNLYYESCAVLLTMIELGQFLEAVAKRRASDAMGALMSLTPEYALRLNAEDTAAAPEQIGLDQVRVGDHLLLRPGGRVPVDGLVLTGKSAIDLSLLTGESIPVPVGPGDRLAAGSVNGEGSLTFAAEAVGGNTRLARIIRLVREAQGSKAPIARLADRVSFYFVPAVMPANCSAAGGTAALPGVAAIRRRCPRCRLRRSAPRRRSGQGGLDGRPPACVRACPWACVIQSRRCDPAGGQRPENPCGRSCGLRAAGGLPRASSGG